MTPRRFRVGLLLLAAVLPGAASAMDPGQPLRLYKRERWGAEEGFSGGGVHAIAQGRDGYLWLGTQHGLVRFDGTDFTSVPETAAAAGGVRDVLGIVVDREGSLWMRPDRPVLLRYDSSGIQVVPFTTHPREVAVTAMTLGRAGELLAYGQVSGLFARPGERFEPRTLETLPTSVVLSMVETADGTLFFGTRDSGLFRAIGSSVVQLLADLPDNKVNSLFAVSERDVWVGTDRGVVRWNGDELTTSGVPEALRGVQALALLRDRDANLWVGTSTGVLRATARGVEALPAIAGAAPAAVTALFEDREGDLWLASGSGIERLHDPPFATYTRAQGLPSDAGGAIHVDPRDRVWFAPPEGGLYRIEDERVVETTAGGLDADRVYSIAPTRDGLWIGRQRGGLTRLRFLGDAVAAERVPALAQASVYAVHVARDGTVWAGTLSAGLCRLTNGRASWFTSRDGLPSNSVSALIDTRDGALWVGTPSGLAAWSNGAWTTRGVRDGLPSDSVTALLEDSEGVLWVGTAEGLAFVRSGRVEVPRPALLPLHEEVVGLAESEGGWLWAATDHRVMRVRREPLLQGTLVQSDLVSYGRADGLIGLEGVRRHRSVALDARGRVWFSTNRGLSVVNPRRALAPTAPPLVEIRSLLADERAVGLHGSVRVPPRSQRVRLTYTAVSLQAPERVRFRYRLDGFDEGWSEPAAAREAVYANLAPGPYRFRVAAAGADGLWSGPEAAVAFEILPSLWQTTGFRVAAAAALALLAWLVYVWRLRLVTRRLNAAFEARLAERTRIAQELHDTLLQGFVSASMQLHVAKEQVDAASPARAVLSRVQQLVAQVIEEGRNAVRGLRAPSQETTDLAEDFSRVREELAGSASAELHVIVEGEPRELHPSVRDALYRIGREALANAFLHARASRVELELEYETRAVRLLVRDDGVGVDEEVLRSGREGHYGLSGMRERAEAIGGRLRLLSAPGAGSEVELVVRGAVAYTKPVLGRWWSLRSGRRRLPG